MTTNWLAERGLLMEGTVSLLKVSAHDTDFFNEVTQLNSWSEFEGFMTSLLRKWKIDGWPVVGSILKDF